MTLLDRILERGYEMPIDPIIAGRIERHMRRIQPDPLFQRRLRGQVVNRYVATREGMVAATQAAPAATPQPERARPRHALRLAADRDERHRGRRRRAAEPAGRRPVRREAASSNRSAWSSRRPACVTTWRPWPWTRGSTRSRRWRRPDVGPSGRGGGGRRASADHARRADRIGERWLRRGRRGAARQHVDRLAELISTAPDAAKRGLLRALAASGGIDVRRSVQPRPRDRQSRAAQGTSSRTRRARAHRDADAGPSVPAASPTPKPTADAQQPEEPGDEPSDGGQGGGRRARDPQGTERPDNGTRSATSRRHPPQQRTG